MAMVALFEAKNKLTEYVRQAENGESIELTRHGKPVAVLVGIDEFRRLTKSTGGFSASCARYREDWGGMLCAEAQGAYGDPFEGLRSDDSGRDVSL